MEMNYKEILQRICDDGFVSTSLIQRKFQIGYAKAARFVDVLMENDIIEKQINGGFRRILNKESFMSEGEKYFHELFKFYDPDLIRELKNRLSDRAQFVEIAMLLIANDQFAKKVDKILCSKFSEIEGREERIESFRVMVYGNYARSEIVALLVNDFVSKILKNDLDCKLDDFWRNRVKNYKSFLEDNDGKTE